jgi:hypothetical protein
MDFFIKISVEEGCFYIKLKKLQVLDRHYVEKKSKGFHLYYEREDFVEV